VPTSGRARLRDTLASVLVVSFHTDHCCLQSRTWAVGSSAESVAVGPRLLLAFAEKFGATFSGLRSLPPKWQTR
jgi:hypothetical protein